MTAVMNENNTVLEMRPFRVKDPISAGTHFIAALSAVAAAPALLVHSITKGYHGMILFGMSVFMISMILLYTASTMYHTFDIPGEKGMILKRIDHMSIFILIAGTYTPCCISMIGGSDGLALLAAVWGIAFAGIIFKHFWVTCPRWVSSVIYILMGWAVIWKMPALIAGTPVRCFVFLLAGGLFYTVGGIIYALKIHIIPENSIGFGNHELFHIMVMLGSLCHWWMLFIL